MESKTPYNEAFCHFDVLIWQVPAWATAIFVAIFVIASFILGKKPENFILNDRISQIHLMAVMSFIFGVFTFILSYTLYRFRWHQTIIKKNNWPTQEHRVISPQLLLQIVVMFEAGFLIIGSAFLFDFYVFVVTVVITVFLFGMIVHWEHNLRLLTKKKSSEIDKDTYSRLKQGAS